MDSTVTYNKGTESGYFTDLLHNTTDLAFKDLPQDICNFPIGEWTQAVTLQETIHGSYDGDELFNSSYSSTTAPFNIGDKIYQPPFVDRNTRMNNTSQTSSDILSLDSCDYESSELDIGQPEASMPQEINGIASQLSVPDMFHLVDSQRAAMADFPQTLTDNPSSLLTIHDDNRQLCLPSIQTAKRSSLQKYDDNLITTNNEKELVVLETPIVDNRPTSLPVLPTVEEDHQHPLLDEDRETNSLLYLPSFDDENAFLSLLQEMTDGQNQQSQSNDSILHAENEQINMVSSTSKFDVSSDCLSDFSEFQTKCEESSSSTFDDGKECLSFVDEGQEMNDNSQSSFSSSLSLSPPNVDIQTNVCSRTFSSEETNEVSSSSFENQTNSCDLSLNRDNKQELTVLDADDSHAVPSKRQQKTTTKRTSPSSSMNNSGDDSDDATRDKIKKTRKTWANVLPPCRVCAEPASGVHYGVNSCEACKVFFKRCLNRKRPLRCKGKGGSCRVQGNKRVGCAFCRYQWCVAMGMSRDSIKLGRYTFSKRSENTEEVKKRASCTRSPDTVTTDQLQQLTDTLLQAHEQVYTNWNLSQEEVTLKGKQRKEQLDLEQELFGNSGQLSFKEYEEFYQQTGLDIDGRQKLLHIYAQCMHLQIRGFIHFAKGIPEFRSLSLDDQARLLKEARSELVMLGIYRGFHHEYRTFVNPSGICFSGKERSNAFGEEREQAEHVISKKLQRLNVLTQAELVLLKAICLTFPERCVLDDRAKVEAIQWRLICAFLKSLQIHHNGNDDIRFSDVIDCLLELRTWNDDSRKSHDKTQLVASVLKKNPILKEVMLH